MEKYTAGHINSRFFFIHGPFHEIEDDDYWWLLS